MLYIFHVDTGTTITFDIELALQSVAQLKEAIERECGIVAEKQVLLMSGGETLEPNIRVCSYSAGTDTNPIFLFSKTAIESHIPPTPSIDYGSDVDLQNQIDASLAMPATYHTLVARAQLAQQCCGLAREQTRICERLVHDQHLQQQGWTAVVANLEDITILFQSRADLLQQAFSNYLTERQQYVELLNNFNADLSTLSKIPILPALRAQADGLLSPEDQAAVEQSSQGNNEVLSLLKWISTKDNQSSLEQVAEQCSKGLEQFDVRMMESLMSEVNATVENSDNQEMKEVKGLGDRLYALEQLMVQMKKLVHEQSELAQGFLQNQTRANNLGDASVLPDLCTSHRRQLMVMLQNHNQLRDIRRRCTKAKEELSVNIHRRLQWIMYVESNMIEIDSKLLMYHESLKRLRRHMEVLQQINLAPQMYLNAVAEVVRRRTFSQAFLVWASNLACQLLTVHSEELARRRDFQSKFNGHFLNTLFPGLEDTPPPFATQAPSVFDSGLPKLTADDMESLKAQLPDVTLTISNPDLHGITQFFLSKSLTEGSSSDGNKVKGDGSMQDDATKEQEVVRAPMLGDRGGFESETDTEEFEKIGQGALDVKINSFEDAKLKRQKQSEENLGNTRGEVERLRCLLRTMKTTASDVLGAFREELATLRERTMVERNGFDEMIENVRQSVALHTRECERSLQEREQELTVDHELEMADVKRLIQNAEEEMRTMKQTLQDKEAELSDHKRLVSTMRQKMDSEQSEMRALQSRLHHLEEALERAHADKEIALKETTDASLVEIATLTNSVTQCQERVRQLEDSLSVARADRQKLVKEATDKLQMEYKTELENIRSRFKLMAASTMERSPSDSSLEKIERPDVIELAKHEAILAQLKEDVMSEKMVAIRAAIEKERSECAAKLDHELRLARQRSDTERQVMFNEAMRTVIEEKDREVEMHRTRELTLAEECERYKSTIRRLTESESMVRQTLSEKVECLEADKVRLEANIVAERKILEQRENQVQDLEAERHELRNLEETLKVMEAEKDKLKAELNIHRKDDEVEVSESKKVRLEENGDSDGLTRRIEILENENNRLTAELRLIREGKEAAETKVEALEADKVRLEVELVKERSRRVFGIDSTAAIEGRDKDMSSSVAVVSESSSRDAATSSELSRREASTSSHVRDRLTKSTESLVQQGRVTVKSCNPGDIVLMRWDVPHKSYMVLQESSTFFFLNMDCADDCADLRLNPDGTPQKLHVIAEVIDKEYCHAKKPENRYRVPLGTKFYRVRVRSVRKDSEADVSAKSQQ